MPITFGRRPDKQKPNAFFSPKPDQTYKLTLLYNIDQIVSCDQFEIWDTKPAIIWPDIGPSDPGRLLHLRPQWRSFIPVLVDDSTEPLIWAMKRKQHEAIMEASDAAEEDTKGMIVQFKRVGSGMTTRYSVTATPRRAKTLPKDVIAPEAIAKMLNERTADEVIKEITTALGMKWNDVVEMFDERHSADVAKRAAEKKGSYDDGLEVL